MKIKAFFILFCCLWGSEKIAQNSPFPPFLEELNEQFTTVNPLEHTAYVSQFWRWPGNPGYDSTIFYIAKQLEKAGFQNAQSHPEAALSYRISEREMPFPSWSPIDASLTLGGDSLALMQFSNNRNMIAIRSASTVEEGITTEVVWLKNLSAENWDQDMEGKIVFCEASPRRFFRKARKKGAVGIFAYSVPGFNQPVKNDTLISFTSLPTRDPQGGWALLLSYRAKEALKAHLRAGKKEVHVKIQTAYHTKPELSIVAELSGNVRPNQRIVYSAHVQEPGANDNASGVGCQLAMAEVAAKLYQAGKINARTVTFYWGNEISGIYRYLSANQSRTDSIIVGISLDMVGEDTEKTGGTFLIEKMPDPSAIWTRGEDQHTEWGAGDVGEKDLFPHYLNDFILNRCLEVGNMFDWEVRTNPFEGGSDHIPFLQQKKAAVLLWHFTDQFYHTDGDQIDKVSPITLRNVGISALASGLILANANQQTAQFIRNEIKDAAISRLSVEFALSKEAIAAGSTSQAESKILRSWGNWYIEALKSCNEIPVRGYYRNAHQYYQTAQSQVQEVLQSFLKQLK